MTIGFLVGMRAEARLLRPLRGAAPIAVSGATRAGAANAARLLIRAGATELVSFGLAAGLDPAMRPGTLLVPSYILVDGHHALPDLSLCARLGGVTAGGLLHSDEIVAGSAAKRALHARTGCAALDMESGAVARAAQAAGLAFAALRAVCDPAERDLPEVAARALDSSGRLAWTRMLAALLRRPGQVPQLALLAGDAARARRALAGRIPLLRL